MAVKQACMFPSRNGEMEQKYTSMVEAPVYHPAHRKPHILMLCDQLKTKRLLRDIEASKLPEEEKEFLRVAAHRHTVFHYERIADYYAHASVEMQQFMEASALVIIDFNAAIEHGYIRLCEDIRRQYLEEYVENDDIT